MIRIIKLIRSCVSSGANSANSPNPLNISLDSTTSPNPHLSTTISTASGTLVPQSKDNISTSAPKTVETTNSSSPESAKENVVETTKQNLCQTTSKTSYSSKETEMMETKSGYDSPPVSSYDVDLSLSETAVKSDDPGAKAVLTKQLSARGRGKLKHSVSIVVEPAVDSDEDILSDLPAGGHQFPSHHSERRNTIAGPILIMEDFHFGRWYFYTSLSKANYSKRRFDAFSNFVPVIVSLSLPLLQDSLALSRFTGCCSYYLFIWLRCWTG